MAYLTSRTVGALNDRRVLRAPVRVFAPRRSGPAYLDEAVARVDVLAHSVADAANHVMALFRDQPGMRVEVYGPKGGVVERYVGYATAIGHLLGLAHRERQLSLPF